MFDSGRLAPNSFREVVAAQSDPIRKSCSKGGRTNLRSGHRETGEGNPDGGNEGTKGKRGPALRPSLVKVDAMNNSFRLLAGGSACLPLLGALAAGCSSSGDGQVVKGQLALSSFPAGVDNVRVMQGSTLTSEAIPTSDGAFELTIPAGKGYSLELRKGDALVGLVFPRASGSVEHSFAVAGGGSPFDLGNVRYVGDISTKSFSFGEKAGDGDGECENGIDAETGAVCVDDDHENEACDDGEENEDEEGGVDCVDGIDSATGAECDGGPSANQDDGEEDDDAETDDDGPAEAAVADHNLPASLGCGEEEEDGEENDD